MPTKVLVTDPDAVLSWLISANDALELAGNSVELVVIDQTNAYDLHHTFIARVMEAIQNHQPDFIIIGNNRGSGVQIFKSLTETYQKRAIITSHFGVNKNEYPGAKEYITRDRISEWLIGLPSK